MDEHSVEQYVRRLTAQWKGTPPVRVVATPDDLPFSAPSDVQGAYVPRTQEAYIVSEPHLARTMAHEIIAHHGVRQVLGVGAWRAFMVAVQAGADAHDERLQAARIFVRWAYADADGEPVLSRVLEADEVLASFAEALIDYRTGRLAPRHRWSSWWHAARGHVSREVLLRDEPASYAEIEGVLLAAEHRLRHGGLFWGLAQRWYRAAMTKPMGPARPATSLEESNRLLRSAKNQEAMEIRFKQFLRALPMTLAALGIIGSLVAAFLFVLLGAHDSLLDRLVGPTGATLIVIAIFVSLFRG